MHMHRTIARSITPPLGFLIQFRGSLIQPSNTEMCGCSVHPGRGRGWVLNVGPSGPGSPTRTEQGSHSGAVEWSAAGKKSFKPPGRG